MTTFTHLCIQSHYSLHRSTASIEALAAWAQQSGYAALPIADHNALYGAVVQQRVCTKLGIRPIVGLTLDVALNNGQLVLLAKNREGYRNLCRLSSLIQTGVCERVSAESLRQHADGLICIEAGRFGPTLLALQHGDEQAATHYLSTLSAIYADNLYLGLHMTQALTVPILQNAVALAARFGIEPVVTQLTYCLKEEDVAQLRLLRAISQNCALADVPAEDELVHWLDEAAMTERYAAFPEALARTTEIAAQCEAPLPDGRPIWPKLALGTLSAAETLAQNALAGLHQLYGDPADADIIARLEKELAAITKHGFSPLFLIVADIVRYARSAEIPLSTRGSVANSLVAYCVGITTVDPIEYDLLFERFLNPARVTLPDIDLDFCSRRRDLVLDYVRQTYGADRVALVATVATLRPKSAVRATGKAFGYDSKRLKALTKLLPSTWGPHQSESDATRILSVLEQIADPQERRVLKAAAAIAGQPDHLSVHPGGIVITPEPLTDFVPVQMAPKGFIITQFDHGDVEEIGLPKMDLLGIRALTVAADSAELIRSHTPAFKLSGIPNDDMVSAEIIRQGATIGVFQCESVGSQKTLRKLNAKNVQDMAVANAFFKPGPALGGMAKAFVRRYRGEESVSFLHPSLEPILAKTQGVLLFQEQVLRVAVEVADLDWSQANEIRKGISKFQGDRLRALKEEFVLGCQRQAVGMTPEQAEQLWTQVESFAGYGFNQGHATAYAAVSYQSAYLKAHYPAEFLAARLKNGGGYHYPAVYIAEARRLGFAVQPPHVNHGGRKFALETVAGKSTLWMGLGWVRDLRRKSIMQIVAERPFSGLEDLLTRVPLQQKEVRHLIQCGALDGFGKSRETLLFEFEHMGKSSGAQLKFAFEDAKPVSAEIPPNLADYVEWEKHILDMPVSVHPIDVLGVSAETQRDGKMITVFGTRLPGWERNNGFYLSNSRNFIRIQKNRDRAKSLRTPAVWQPVKIEGTWQKDAYGGQWLEMLAVTVL